MFDLNAIFSEMRTAVSEACRSENFTHATSKAKELGMVLEGDETPHRLRYDYRAANSQNDYVWFHFRSYDQSQAFSVRPDMNKFELELVLGGRKAGSQYDSYED